MTLKFRDVTSRQEGEPREWRDRNGVVWSEEEVLKLKDEDPEKFEQLFKPAE